MLYTLSQMKILLSVLSVCLLEEKYESSRILTDELREREKGEGKRAATSSVVRLRPFSKGNQQKRKSFHPPLVRPPSWRDERRISFYIFSWKNGTAFPGASLPTVRRPDVTLHPALAGEGADLLSAWP